MAVATGNEEQAAYWSEVGGRSWVDFQAQMDRQLAPLGEAVFEAIAPQPGESVLDVGCGCGATTLALAEAVGPTGRVVGVDVSTSMLAIATASLAAAGHRHGSAVLGDAQTVSPVELGGQVDVVFSRFGVMFFNDPIAAFANIRTLTKPDGRLGFVCWQSPSLNGWMNNLGQVLKAFLPAGPPPDPYAPGPFAFADPDRTAEILSSTGWSDVAVDPLVRSMQLFGTNNFDEALEGSMRIGAAARLLQGADAATVAKVRQAAREALESQWTPGGIVVDGVCWLVTAQNLSS